MNKTVELMIEATRDTPVEIVNYNYARIPLLKNEVDDARQKGLDLPAEITNALNAVAKELKEKFSVDFSAEVTGDGKTVVFIKGVGRLYDNNPDAFTSLVKIRDRVVAELLPSGTGSTSEPANKTESQAPPVVTAATASPSSPAAPSTKPPSIKIAKSTAVKPAPAAAKPVSTASPAKETPSPAPSPAKPMAAKPAPTPSPTAKPPAEQKSTEEFASISTRIAEKKLVERVELVRLLVDKFKVNETAAASKIDSFLTSNTDFIEDCGFIFKKK